MIQTTIMSSNDQLQKKQTPSQREWGRGRCRDRDRDRQRQTDRKEDRKPDTQRRGDTYENKENNFKNKDNCHQVETSTNVPLESPFHLSKAVLHPREVYKVVSNRTLSLQPFIDLV